MSGVNGRRNWIGSDGRMGIRKDKMKGKNGLKFGPRHKRGNRTEEGE